MAGFREQLAVLDQYYVPTRYPNGLPGGIPADVYTGAQAAAAMDVAHRIVSVVRRELVRSVRRTRWIHVRGRRRHLTRSSVGKAPPRRTRCRRSMQATSRPRARTVSIPRKTSDSCLPPVLASTPAPRRCSGWSAIASRSRSSSRLIVVFGSSLSFAKGGMVEVFSRNAVVVPGRGQKGTISSSPCAGIGRRVGIESRISAQFSSVRTSAPYSSCSLIQWMSPDPTADSRK